MKRGWHIIAGLGLLMAGVATTHAQAPVPLGDEVQEALAPAGVSRSPIEMFGELVYLWQEADGANVVHFLGDFELQMGRRRLYAREAVIWMTPRRHDDLRYIRFDVVLWHDARVVEPSGTITRGPLLYVTFNASGTVETSADRKSFSSSADMGVYQDAKRVRDAFQAGRGEGEDLESPLTVVDLSAKAAPPEIEVRPPISYQGRDATYQEVDGRRVLVITGDVYVFRGAPKGADFIELRADGAVVYFTSEAEEPREPEQLEERPGRGRAAGKGETAAEGPLGDLGGKGGAGVEGVGNIEAVYLEGDITLARGEQFIRATKLYYDFQQDQALILDAVFRAVEPKRNVPIYVRADSIRQLSATEFRAEKARFTTSEFYTPHYHVGAEELTIVDRTPREPVSERRSGPLTGTFAMRHATFNVEGTPLLYWPYVRGDLQDTETSLKGIRAGYSGDFGAELATRWDLFNIMGLQKPAGFDGDFLLDYYSDRGPAVGANLNYETDNYFGLYRGFYVYDNGEDDLGGRFRDEDPDTKNRGRSTWRHRQYLGDGWELTLEASYISDKNFMEEWFRPEFENGKEQETLLQLKKQEDIWAFTAIAQPRILDFVTTTERLPDFSFRVIGDRLGDFATLFSENRAGLVRYRPRDPENFYQELLQGWPPEEGSGTVVRGDTRQEAEVPFSVGDFKLVPFGSIRGSGWDDSPEEGGLARVFGTYGLRGSSYLWKAFPDVSSKLLDVNGIRHVVKTDVTAWAAHTNTDSPELYPFDETVEQIDEVDGVSMGVRQRFQTKRGGPNERRTTDLLTLDTEVGFFNDAAPGDGTDGYTSFSRPENSISRNYLYQQVIYRINDATDLAAEANWDFNDNDLDVFNLTYAVERTPRLSYLVGYRFIGDTDSNLLAGGFNYQLNEKYTLAMREEFDLDRGDTAEFDVGIIRKFPRWFVGITFSLDNIDDDYGVSLSAWPEGLPQAALGSRRFTGLTTSTGINPE